jgi:Uma2 family endonuclease
MKGANRTSAGRMTVKRAYGPADHGVPVGDGELRTADFQPGFSYEVIDGRLYVSPAPEEPHDFVVAWLHEALIDYQRQHPGRIKRISQRARVFVPGHRQATAPEPDLAVYDRYPKVSFWRRDWRHLSPMLVVETVSREIEKDYGRNVSLYQQVPSIKEYWVVHYGESPASFSFRAYVKKSGRWLKEPKDVGYGQTYTTPLLPGFSLLIKPE